MSILTSAIAIIKDKTAVEAGYVNNPDDLGGPTIWGITQQTANEDEYKHLWGQFNWNGDMRTMPKEMAYAIYKQGWWDKMQLDRIAAYSWPLAERLFDFAINAGRVNCAQSLQKVLNSLNRNQQLWSDITPLGTTIGPVTLKALDDSMKAFKNDPHWVQQLCMLMFSMQNYHYVHISLERARNETFTKGWVNRVYRDFYIYAKWLTGN
jgi:lysozyme family protein